MANGRRVVTFDSFARGDYGLASEWNAPSGSYRGKNVQTYIDGSVGPRSGLVDLAVQSVPVGDVVGFGVNASQEKVWAIIADKAYQFSSVNPTAPAMVALAGSLASVPTKRVRSTEVHQYTYITSYNDKCYELDHPGAALNALAGSPGGRVIASYGEFLAVGSPASSHGDRVRFSAPGDVSSWPADNEFAVGNGYEIVALVPLRQYLAVAKHDGSWWIISGTLGVSDFVRRIIRAFPLGVEDGVTRWGSAGDGTLWAVERRDANEHPVIFNGSTARRVEDQIVGNVDEARPDGSDYTNHGASGLERPNDVFLMWSDPESGPDSGRGLLLYRGLWSKHEFAARVSGWVDGRLQRRIYLAEGHSTTGAATKFFAWEYQLDRPPRDQPWESIGDASDTPLDAEFFMPEWYAKDEEEVRARAVIVDFKKYEHGFDADNTFTIEYTPLRKFESGDGDPITRTWSEDQSDAEPEGVVDRHKANLGPQWSNGFRVGITGIVGVAIQKIHVILETQPTRAVA